MKRIAYISPLNPAPSGISDYSEELLPYLGQHCEITLYADEKLRPTNRAMLAQLPLRPLPQRGPDAGRPRLLRGSGGIVGVPP